MSQLSNISAPQPPVLLVVEDSQEDFEVLQRYIRQYSEQISIYRCTKGDEALAFLQRQGAYEDPTLSPRPALILMDLNLPGTDGRDILCQLKQDAHLKTIPVIVLTTSNNPKDVKACYQQGANSYVIKPMDFLRLKQSMHTLLSYWLDVTVLPVAFTEGGVL
jgi:CheY-like chemotaxis protein